MKISQSNVRVSSTKPVPGVNNNAKGATALKAPAAVKKAPLRTPPTAGPTANNLLGYGETAVAIQRVLASAKQELDLIRRMKAETANYQQAAATKARSEAHQLVLNARLTTHREIEEVVRQASEEIQKVLADIRVIRITAQEELATQRRYTDAVKLNNISQTIKEAFKKEVEQEKKTAEAIKT
jgi:hypothetical protein